MSWSNLSRRALITLAFVGAASALTGCSSFRPAYGNASGYAFHYGDPGNRTDQIIYSELRLRLGPASNAPDAIDVRVSTSTAARGLTRTATAGRPASTAEMVVTAAISVATPDGTVIFSGTRTAAATYTTVGQVLADTEGQTDATERGAKSLADTVRLAILGALATKR